MFKLFAFFSVYIICVHAQVLVPGKCPDNVSVQQNFDLSKVSMKKK